MKFRGSWFNEALCVWICSLPYNILLYNTLHYNTLLSFCADGDICEPHLWACGEACCVLLFIPWYFLLGHVSFGNIQLRVEEICLPSCVFWVLALSTWCLKMHDFQSMVNMNQAVVIVGLSKYPNCLHATFDMLCTILKFVGPSGLRLCSPATIRHRLPQLMHPWMCVQTFGVQ